MIFDLYIPLSASLVTLFELAIFVLLVVFVFSVLFAERIPAVPLGLSTHIIVTGGSSGAVSAIQSSLASLW